MVTAAFFAGAFLAVAAFVAGAVVFLAGAAAFFAGAAFFAVAVLRAEEVAATARWPLVTGTATEMPSPLRCARSALRCCGATSARSLASRTWSGVRLPWGRPASTRPEMAGWDNTAAGSSLRAFEDTNTSRRMIKGAARQG